MAFFFKTQFATVSFQLVCEGVCSGEADQQTQKIDVGHGRSNDLRDSYFIDGAIISNCSN